MCETTRSVFVRVTLRLARVVCGVCGVCGASAHAAAFSAGTVVRGAVAVEFDAKGIPVAVSHKGIPLMGQHPGGVSTSGYKDDRWSPWVPQSQTRVDVERSETPEAVTVRVRGSLKPRGIPDGETAFEVVTVVSEDRLTQTARASTPVEGLWQSFGSAWILDPDAYSLACFRREEDAWTLIPDKPRDRNLIPGSRAARTVELITAATRLTFRFDGVNTAFFDDRDKQWRNFKLEFGTPQQRVSDSRGQVRHEGGYGLTIEFSENTDGVMPIEVPRLEAAPVGVAAMLLTEPGRTLEAPPHRRRFSLDGTWNLQTLGSGKEFPQELLTYPPRAGIWSEVSVPDGPYPRDGWSGPEHAAWYAVHFVPPAASATDDRFILHIEEISYWSVFYLNGRKLGEHFGGYVPVRLDATRLLRPGVENRLEIFVGDATAALDPRRYPQGAPASAERRDTVPDSITAPVYWAHRGILQSVWLESVPVLHVDDVFVKTWVEARRLEVETTVANATEAIQTVEVRHAVLDDGRVIQRLEAATVTIPPHGSGRLEQAIGWTDPILWDVGSPHLYHLETEVLSNGEAVDVRRTRFGFREFRVEGPDLVLNGKKIRLREAATHLYYHPGRVTWDERYKGDLRAGARAEIKALQAANFNATRMVHRPHPTFFHDICDELGHLAISHMPFGFHIAQFQLDNPNLVANSARIVSGLVRKERNHPSIVMWEVENEGFPYGLDAFAYQMANFYEQGVMAPIRRLDPTRPLKSGGDGDILGRTDVIDMHGGDWPNLDDVPLPNSNWQVLDRPSTRCYGFVGGLSWRWDRGKPLYFGEGLYWMFEDTKARGARMIGETVFDDAHLGDQWVRNQEHFLETAQSAYWRIGLPVWRMLGELAGYCPWAVAPGFGTTLTMEDRPVINAAREMLKPERFFVKQLHRNYLAGAPVRLDVCFVNDSRETHDYRIVWRARLDGENVAEDSFLIGIEPAGTVWRTLAFDLPAVARRSTVDLTVAMQRGDTTIFEEMVPLRGFPAMSLPGALTADMVLVDPEGTTEKTLERLGARVRRVGTLDEALKRQPNVVIIGENALAADTDIPIDLDVFVRGGGRVLMLAQAVMKPYGPMTRADDEPRRTRALVFPSDAGHPLLAGLAPEDFQFWNHPEWDLAHAVARHARQKFGTGAVRSVLECDSLWFSPLQEVRYGAGLYIECALDIVRKAGHEPVAGIVWRNVLERLAGWEAPGYRTLRILRDRERAEAFQAQGIVCEPVDDIPADGIVLVTNASQLRADEADAIRACLDAGGTLWMHPRAGADVDTLRTVTGLSIKTRPYTADKRAREVRRTADGRDSVVLAGISSVALYARNSVDELWAVEGEQVRELATGGAVVTAEAGAGRLLIDRLAWDHPENLVHQQWADHYLHALCANLGVEIDPYRYRERRVLRSESFVPIDLRAVFNRGFRDEVAGDGEGGWTDQGPQNDLRGMAPGRRPFHQVIIDIVDPAKNDGNACLVLYAAQHAETGPKATPEIPYGGRASSLFFLHTAAWFNSRTHADKPVIRYVVTYADGQTAVVEALGNRHIRDWWTPGDAEEAKGVSLFLVSETEPDAPPRRRGLQIQEWVNPRPDQTIRSIRIESANSGAIPIVLGISAWNAVNEEEGRTQ